MEENSSVVIKRLGSALTKKEFEVYIDGRRRIGIAGNETEVTLPLEPGNHRIQVLGMNWIKTPELRFSVEPNVSTTYECGYSNARAIMMIIGIILVLGVVDVVYAIADGAITLDKWVAKPFVWLAYLYLVSRPGAIMFLRPFKEPE